MSFILAAADPWGPKQTAVAFEPFDYCLLVQQGDQVVPITYPDGRTEFIGALTRGNGANGRVNESAIRRLLQVAEMAEQSKGR